MKLLPVLLVLSVVPALISLRPIQVQSADDSDGHGTCKAAYISSIVRPNEADCAAHACDPQGGGTCAPSCNYYEWEQGHCPGTSGICELLPRERTDRLCIECGACDGHCHAQGIAYPVGTKPVMDCAP